MFRLVLNCFAVLWLFAPSIVFAAETRIGSSGILLPEIDGFQLISGDSPGIHLIASRFAQQCDGIQCGVYSGGPNRADLVSKTWEAVQPFFLVDILDDDRVVGSGEFPGLMQLLKADTKSLRAQVAASFAEMPLDVNIDSPEGSEEAKVIIEAWRRVCAFNCVSAIS